MAIFRPLPARSPQRPPDRAWRNKVPADSADDPDDADKLDDIDDVVYDDNDVMCQVFLSVGLSKQKERHSESALPFVSTISVLRLTSMIVDRL